MKLKEFSFNHIKKYKISKNGLLENDKHLIISKLGFHNLSQLNLPQSKEKRNNIIHKKKNSIFTIKNESKHLNKSVILIKKIHSNNTHKKNILSNPKENDKNIKNNNISTYSSNEIINEFSKNRKFYKTNITSQDKKLIFNKNKSYNILPIKPLVNNKTIPNAKNMNKFGRNKHFINSFKTTATNSYKDIKSNKNMSSSNNLSNFPKAKNLKTINNINKIQKDKLSKTMNLTSLLNDVKNQ